jgi:inosine/xanthosine triphosphate pyrophosphatase family protein
MTPDKKKDLSMRTRALEKLSKYLLDLDDARLAKVDGAPISRETLAERQEHLRTLIVDRGGLLSPNITITFVPVELEPTRVESALHAMPKEIGNNQIDWKLMPKEKDRNLELPTVQDRRNLETVVRDQCINAARLVNGPVLVELHILCCDALHGLPGLYTADLVSRIKPAGLVRMLRPFNNMRAQAVTIFAFCPGPGVVPKVKQAPLSGQLVERVVAEAPLLDAKGGDATCSWHAVFQPDGHSKTLTEMEEDRTHFPEPNAVRGAVLHGLLASELHAMRRERERLNEVRLRC